MRTIRELRNQEKGKLYVWLKDDKTIKEFLHDAELEGYLFDKTKPTETEGDNIIAIEGRKQLSYLGFVGHIAFNTNQVVKVDYEAYKGGKDDYYYKTVSDGSEIKKIDIDTRFHGRVFVMGDDREKGAKILLKNIPLCKNEKDEHDAIEKVEKMGEIWVVFDE